MESIEGLRTRAGGRPARRHGTAPLLYSRRRYLRVEEGVDSPVQGKPEG